LEIFAVPFLSYLGVNLPEKVFFAAGLSSSAVFFLPVLFVNQLGSCFFAPGTRPSRS